MVRVKLHKGSGVPAQRSLLFYCISINMNLFFIPRSVYEEKNTLLSTP